MKIFSFLMLVLLSVSSAAEVSPGTIGFQFLRTSVGARPAGMGGAFLAIPGDVHGIYYNPAGLAYIDQPQATFTYHNHLLDLNSGFMGAAHPVKGAGVLGYGILYMDFGKFDKTDIEGQRLGDFGANSIALSASLSNNIWKNVSVGISGKYIRAAIESYSSDAIATDLAMMVGFPSQSLYFAAGYYNLGTTLSAFVQDKAPLPAHFKIGFSKKLAHLPLLFSFNLYKFDQEQWHGSVGGEFILSNYVLFRLGYDHVGQEMQVGTSKDQLAGAALGFGFLFKQYRIDYALTHMGELGTVNRFTLSGQF
jgi:hypothetical protein